MTKYILKKDLPFAKAGEKARVFFGSSSMNIYYHPDQVMVDFHFPMEGSINKLLSEGWIEEAEPEDRQSVEYWEYKLRNRKDTTYKTTARIDDYPALWRAAENLGASSICIKDGWTAINFMSVEVDKMEKKPRELYEVEVLDESGQWFISSTHLTLYSREDAERYIKECNRHRATKREYRIIKMREVTD